MQLDVSGKVSKFTIVEQYLYFGDLLPDTKELGQESIALGINAYYDEILQGIGNIGIGIDSLEDETTGDRNVAIGYHTLK